MILTVLPQAKAAPPEDSGVLFLPERVRVVLQEAVLVPNHVYIADRGEEPELVQRILLFLFIQVDELDLLQCIFVPIGEPPDLVDAAVCALA